MRTSWIERFGWLLRQSAASVYDDHCLETAKAAAYSALLAFFPVLTALALALVRFRAEQVGTVISNFLFEVVPPGTKDMVVRQFALEGEKPSSLLVIAGIVALWAASGLILSLIEGFNALYKIPRGRPLIRGRLVAVALVFCSALPALGASALILFGGRTEQWLVRRLGLAAEQSQFAGGLLLAGSLTRSLIALGATVVTTALLYKFGPNRRQRWRNVWPGAMIVAVLWFAATSAFSWYVRNIADYNLLYGSIGAVIALILWLYLLSILTLFGCAFNAERERLEAAARTLDSARPG